jgi:hypothetical protein
MNISSECEINLEFIICIFKWQIDLQHGEYMLKMIIMSSILFIFNLDFPYFNICNSDDSKKRNMPC